MRIDAQQAHESEIRAIFAAERSRLEDENKKLREQLVIAASDVSYIGPIILNFLMSVDIAGIEGARKGCCSFPRGSREDRDIEERDGCFSSRVRSAQSATNSEDSSGF